MTIESKCQDAGQVHGECSTRFAAVREVFSRSLKNDAEIGAAVAVTVDGDPVIDLWAGHADQARLKPWERDTIVNVYSTTKAMAALCGHILIEEGRLDLDAPVVKYWPEFGQGGKDRVPVRWLFSHRSGLAAIRETLPGEALYQWRAMVDALAAETPWWEPGTAHGYHAVTFGWLVGELVRRISGMSLGAFFRQRVAVPLGLDFHIGLADSEHDRVAEMSPLAMPLPDFEGVQLAKIILGDLEGVTARAFLNPPSLALGVNVPEWRRAEIPGANGHGTARSLARVYGCLARGGSQDGVHLLSPSGVARIREEQSVGKDLVLQVSTRFGLGVMLPQAARDTRFGPNEEAFGHPGAGGSVGFADPKAKLGFGYVMNKMGPHVLLDPRATELIEAVYSCL